MPEIERECPECGKMVYLYFEPPFTPSEAHCEECDIWFPVEFDPPDSGEPD